MALKSYKPTTPGQRGLVLIDRSELWKGRPVKSLTEGLTKSGGRNNTGRITSRRRGGGAKRLYRIVDFKRTKFDVPATVERIVFDPNRTAFIALVKYKDGEQAYILAPQRLAVGDTVVASSKADIKPGNAMPFSGMPIGTIIHNIELKPERVVKLRERLVPMLNLLVVTVAMHKFGFLLVSCAWFGKSVWQQLVRFLIRIIRTRTTVKQAECVIKAFVPLFGVLS